MDWNKMGAVGSLIGGVFGALAFAVTIWPWPQIKAASWHGVGPKLIGISLVVSFTLSALSIYAAWHRSAFEYNDSLDGIILITGKQFRNEVVSLDGFEYQYCRFENVTFEYNGTRPVRFSYNNISGSIRIKSANGAVGSTAALLKGLGMLSPNIPLLDENNKPIAEPATKQQP